MEAAATSPKQIVLHFIEALNSEDFVKARALVTDDLQFIGVMGTREGADNYFSDMRKMKFKYIVQQAFEDGNDVSLWYDIAMGGKTIFSAGWYKLTNGKISSFKVLFDPRPLLADKK